MLVKPGQPLEVTFDTREQAEELAFTIIEGANNALTNGNVADVCASLAPAAPLFKAIAESV